MVILASMFPSFNGIFFFSDDAKKITNRPRFLEDGGSSIVVAAGGQEYPRYF